MPIKRGSSVDQVGLQPMSCVSAYNPMTGMNPIALPDDPLPVNYNDGGSRSIQPGTGCDVSCATTNFKPNTGYNNP